jgi:imidazolonepropionase-like amidohydrolase
MSMKGISVGITLSILLAAYTAAFAGSAPSSNGGPERVTVIRGGTLIDGNGGPPRADAVVIVQGKRIAAVGDARAVSIPKGAQVIDAHGKFVVPGLIDCHCHLENIGFGDLVDLPPEWQMPDKLKDLIRIDARLDLFSGITTVRDMGSTDLLFQVRAEINSGKISGPRIFAAGHQLVKKAPDAYMDPNFVEYAGPGDARAQVRRQVALGADVIKIRLANDRPLPSLQEMRAVVEEAHRLGLRVAAHTWVPADQAVQLAIDAGVDSIEHNAPLRAKDANVLPEMARRHIALMAGGGSFYVQRWEPWDPNKVLDPVALHLFPPDIVALFSRVGEALRAQTNEMKKQGWNPQQVQARFAGEMQRARTAGVLLVFGTDCGGELMVHGQQYKALYGESQMGSTPMEALLMATRDAARVLGKEAELGTVERGKLADLVIVDADPLADLRNLAKVHAVMKDGRLYFPAQGRAGNP